MYCKLEISFLFVLAIAHSYGQTLFESRSGVKANSRGFWVPIPWITVRPTTLATSARGYQTAITRAPTTTLAPAPALSVGDIVAEKLINSHRATHQVPLVTYSTTLRDAAAACVQRYVASSNPGPITLLQPRVMPRVNCPGANMTGVTVGYNSMNNSNAARAAIDDLSSGWFSQYIYNQNLFPPDAPASYNPAYQDYTQMIWASSTQVGCAFSTSTIPVSDGVNPAVPSYVYLCLWTPAGNVVSTFPANVRADV